MDTGKLVIIGGNAGGMNAATNIRRADKDRKIVVFEKGEYTSYAACGIPYFIADRVESAEKLIARSPEVFREKQDIEVHIHHEVSQIDIAQNRVRVRSLKDNSSFWESYDDLLIATGTLPFVPDIEGADARGVFTLSSLQSGIDVYEYIRANKPAKAVIVGGGYIGIEMAEALLDRKLDVTLIDMEPQVMRSMDSDMAEIISSYMREEGVKVFLEEKLKSIETDSKDNVSAIITNNQKIDTELVILGLGTLPDSEIAGSAGIKLGANNAIRVNKRMETSAPHVWAAGDCAESFHLLTEKQVFIALGTIATKHGQVAGNNISGGNDEFPGVLGTAITKFNSLEISRTGLSEKEAKENGFICKAALIESTTASGYYPSAEKITVKLVAEERSGRLLGGQITGMKGSAKRIDIIVSAILAKMTARDLMFMDLSYAPPFSQVWDPVQVAARKLI